MPSKTAEQKRLDFLDRQFEIDKTYRPTPELLASNPKAYPKAWTLYVKRCKENVASYKRELNYYQTPAAETRDREKKGGKRYAPIPGGKLTIKGASNYLSLAAGALKEGWAAELPPHFEVELQKAISALPKGKKELGLKINALPRQTAAFSRGLNDFAAEMTEPQLQAFRKLPFIHPARRFLALTDNQSTALKDRRKTTKGRKHRNAPTVLRSAYRDFVFDVWENRKTATRENLLLASRIVLGRRIYDIAGVITFSKGSDHHHLIADTLSKKALIYKPETSNMQRPRLDFEFPVIFLDAPQALELVEMAQKAVKDFYGIEDWQARKDSMKSAEFNSVTHPVWRHFKKLTIAQNHKGEKIIGISPHNIARAVYIQIATEQYFQLDKYQGAGLSKIGFANTIMGHGDENLEDTTDYMAINVTMDNAEPKKTEIIGTKIDKRLFELSSAGADKIKTAAFERKLTKLYLKSKSFELFKIHKLLISGSSVAYHTLQATAKNEQELKNYLSLLEQEKISFEVR